MYQGQRGRRLTKVVPAVVGYGKASMPSMTVYGTPSRQERGLPCLYLHTMCLRLGTSLHCCGVPLETKGAAGKCALPFKTMHPSSQSWFWLTYGRSRKAHFMGAAET